MVSSQNGDTRGGPPPPLATPLIVRPAQSRCDPFLKKFGRPWSKICISDCPYADETKLLIAHQL